MGTKASIIIPTFNRSHTLCRAVESALSQTHPEVEVVVVDDCSTDNTQDVIGRFSDPRLVYFRQSVNTNMPASWDAGLRISTGEYFSFLGDDDVLRPEFIANRIKCFEADRDVAVVFGRHERQDSDGNHRSYMPSRNRNRIDQSPQNLIAAALVVEWFITASMYRKSAVMPAWNAAANDGYVFDVGFNTRIVTQGLGKVQYIPTEDVIVSVHAGQVSSAKHWVMMEQKDRLMTKLLGSNLLRSLAKPIGDEFANWHVYWGRLLLDFNDIGAARRHFYEAARIRPWWIHTWRQIFKTSLLKTSLGARVLGRARIV